MAIPTLNNLWRITPKDDRELIRGYAGWPLSVTNLTELTSILNRVAITSAPAVRQVQQWIDEIETLESDYADQVENGTAHLNNAASYEGPTPGKTLSRDDLKKKADVLEWDTSLLRVKYESGGAGGTAGAVLGGRLVTLKGRIFQALGIEPVSGAGSGMATLVRS
ncbi:MAG: hypothetical protein EBT15_10090 [Betaproteobacteria bacterium]|nr:hypothetical protein [Betaproteobacteria bacterium]